mgnify:CR=1 FL=1
MAVLVLLARAARAGVIAADLGSRLAAFAEQGPQVARLAHVLRQRVHGVVLLPWEVQVEPEAQRLIGLYPPGRQASAVMPLLWLAQYQVRDMTGVAWLPVPVIEFVANQIGMPYIRAYEVASFYSMYNLKPVGKYLFEVCQTGPCMLNGSDDIIAYIKEKLGIGVGETTADGLFTLKTVECLGACGYAPMMQQGKHYREHLTKEKVDAIIAEYRAKAN